MRCRPRLPPLRRRSHPTSTATLATIPSAVLLLFCIRIVFDSLARAQTKLSRSRVPRVGWENANERRSEACKEGERNGESLKAGGLSPIFIIHSSLNLFRFLPRFPRLRDPRPLIYLRSFSMSLIAFQKQCGSTVRTERVIPGTRA